MKFTHTSLQILFGSTLSLIGCNFQGKRSLSIKGVSVVTLQLSYVQYSKHILIFFSFTNFTCELELQSLRTQMPTRFSAPRLPELNHSQMFAVESDSNA